MGESDAVRKAATCLFNRDHASTETIIVERSSALTVNLLYT